MDMGMLNMYETETSIDFIGWFLFTDSLYSVYIPSELKPRDFKSLI